MTEIANIQFETFIQAKPEESIYKSRTLLEAVCAPFPCLILRKENCLGNTPAGMTSNDLEFSTSMLEVMTSATHIECCIFPGNKVVYDEYGSVYMNTRSSYFPFLVVEQGSHITMEVIREHLCYMMPLEESAH